MNIHQPNYNSDFCNVKQKLKNIAGIIKTPGQGGDRVEVCWDADRPVPPASAGDGSDGLVRQWKRDVANGVFHVGTMTRLYAIKCAPTAGGRIGRQPARRTLPVFRTRSILAAIELDGLRRPPEKGRQSLTPRDYAIRHQPRPHRQRDKSKESRPAPPSYRLTRGPGACTLMDMLGDETLYGGGLHDLRQWRVTRRCTE